MIFFSPAKAFLITIPWADNVETHARCSSEVWMQISILFFFFFENEAMDTANPDYSANYFISI